MKNTSKTAGRVTELLMAALSLLLLIGVKTWFKTCGPKDDGTFMVCHWAGRIVAAAAVLMLVLAAAHILAKDLKAKMAFDLSIAAAAVMTLLVPGNLITLCMDASMMCRSHTQPWTMAFSVIIILAAAFDAFICRSNIEAEKHRRA